MEQRRPNRAGMTLVELLVIVVIIGILASVGISKFYGAKERAIVGQMRGDLRSVAMAQEMYFNEHGVYYSGPAPAAGFSFTPSAGVSVVIAVATVSGWGASSSSPNTTFTCDLYHGDGGPLGHAAYEGRIACAR